MEMIARFTYEILLFHAVNVRPNDGEVLHSLWWRGVRDIHGNLDVVAHRTWAGLKRAWQRTLRELETEPKGMLTPGQDWKAAVPFVCNAGGRNCYNW